MLLGWEDGALLGEKVVGDALIPVKVVGAAVGAQRGERLATLLRETRDERAGETRGRAWMLGGTQHSVALSDCLTPHTNCSPTAT